MNVIDGNALAEELHASIRDELQILRMSAVQPGLATVVIGEDYGAKAYERHVHRLADELEYGYVCEHLSPEAELADVIATLGKRLCGNRGCCFLAFRCRNGGAMRTTSADRRLALCGTWARGLAQAARKSLEQR